jgi:hypothetical protein
MVLLRIFTRKSAIPFLLSCFWIFLLQSCYHGHGLSPTSVTGYDTGIQGTVTFTGTWPDSTREVRVAALTEYPEGMKDPDSLFQFVINAIFTGNLFYSDTIPRFVNSYDYEIFLNPQIYAWILVVWFPDIDNYLYGIKELGAYYADPNVTERPTPVQVIPGTMTPEIHIMADLTNVHRQTPFFKKKKN